MIKFAFFTTFAMVLQGAVTLFGLYYVHMKVLSWYLQLPLVIIYIAAIILIAVRRFN